MSDDHNTPCSNPLELAGSDLDFAPSDLGELAQAAFDAFT
jgi:hypothetical protein